LSGRMRKIIAAGSKKLSLRKRAVTGEGGPSMMKKGEPRGTNLLIGERGGNERGRNFLWREGKWGTTGKGRTEPAWEKEDDAGRSA